MLPGNPQILTCPHCGGEKLIMSLRSGNTFGAKLWSDNKSIAPMLPDISYIQKCPHCGKYFNRTKQEKYEEANDKSCFDLGTLSFDEMKEALQQFSEGGFADKNEESGIRMMMFHTFNDFYYRNEDNNAISIDANDYQIFVEQGKWLIDNFITSNLLKAEFYREIGDFENAKICLSEVEEDDDFSKQIALSINEKIEANDTKVFLIS